MRRMKMKTTTDIEVRKDFYLRKNPYVCYHCGAIGVGTVGEPEGWSDFTIAHKRKCLTCSKEWHDIYQLIDTQDEN